MPSFMTQDEELSSSQETSAQDQLVERYCRSAKEVLCTAHDRRSAEAMADEICSQFADECSSELVVKATRSLLAHWIEGQWDVRQ